MKTIICGSRRLNITVKDIEDYINEIGVKDKITCVISGMSGNVDIEATWWAKQNKIPTMAFYADWDKYGNAAGPIRNEWMAEEAEMCIAFWDGKSKGAAHMIKTAKAVGMPTYVKVISDGTPEED